MDRQGFIKLYRSIWDNSVVTKDSDHLAVWIYLLTNATHKKQDADFNGRRIELQPGQLVTGRKSISRHTKVSESKVQRILKTFENHHQIEQQTCNKNRLVSILNWNKYQFCERQNKQQLNNKRTTTEQQLNTNKNVKNDKNEKNVCICGLFKNIYLAPSDLESLKRNCPDDWEQRIEELSNYKKSTGKEYKSDYAKLLGWQFYSQGKKEDGGIISYLNKKLESKEN